MAWSMATGGADAPAKRTVEAGALEGVPYRSPGDEDDGTVGIGDASGHGPRDAVADHAAGAAGEPVAGGAGAEELVRPLPDVAAVDQHVGGHGRRTRPVEYSSVSDNGVYHA